MNRIVTLSLGLVLCLAPVGCKPASSTTAPAALAPGYLNSADQAMGQTLSGLRGFYLTMQQDISSGKYAASATEKLALNSLGAAINAANSTYLAYHSGTATQAQAQTAVDAASAQQQAIATSATGGK